MKIAGALAALMLLNGCALAALGSVAGAAAVAPDKAEATPWRGVDASTGRIADIAGLEQLARDFPDSSSVRLRLATAYIREGDKAGARDAVLWLLDRDYAFSAAGQATLAAFFEDFDPALTARLVDAPEPVARSEVFATIPAGARLIEGIARVGDDDWAATSIVDRALYFGRGSDWTSTRIASLGSLSGIVRDPRSGTVWVSSGVYEQTPDPDTAFRGLVGLDLSNRARMRMIAGPNDATPSDLVMADDGRLYASDPLQGRIYAALPDDERLQVLVPSGTFRSPQGLVLVGGGRKLLVSDYRYGLATLDLASGAVARVATDLPVALDGIDGMWAHGDAIVAVQNGIAPRRILLLRLDRGATRIVKVEVLELGHPDWLEPTGGTVHDGAFYYIASGQWDRFGEGGAAKLDTPPLPTIIRRLPLPPSRD